VKLLFVFFLFAMLGIAFAQAGSHITEGGNVSGTNISIDQNSTWHGVVGRISGSQQSIAMLNAVPGHITTIKTGVQSCEYGIDILNLLFSNSPTKIISLSRGDLSVLDAFINRPRENGTVTLVFSKTFRTGYGTITGVPTTYTSSYIPQAFAMGYLQDQEGNIVIIAPVVHNELGFNGSSFDFQLMLTTRNGTPTMYYLTIDRVCNPPKEGGGSDIPYYQEEESEIPAENITPCKIILYCGEWGPCRDGYSYQGCRDLSNCSDIVVYKVKKCAPPEPDIIYIPILYKEMLTVIVKKVTVYWELLALTLIIVLIYFWMWPTINRRRFRRKKK